MGVHNYCVHRGWQGILTISNIFLTLKKNSQCKCYYHYYYDFQRYYYTTQSGFHNSLENSWISVTI